MKIKLLQTTEKPIKLIADIASISYGKEESRNPEKLVRKLLRLEHMSCFEHIFYTWKIEGISLTCLAQLTRHRHASFNVQSMRYTEGNGEVVIPREIIERGGTGLFLEMVDQAYQNYHKLLSMGVKREDARFVLPTASETNLYMSCNLRELLHIYKLRTHKSAQWEINELVAQMVEEVLLVNPELKFMFEGEK